jgi:hypothetical protein
MDRKISKKQEVERLIQLGDRARSCLVGEAVTLRQKLDVPSRIRGSLKAHPSGWLLGSAATGLVASLLFRRKPARQEKKRRGLAFTLFGLILTVVRPIAKVWLTGQLKNYITGQTRNQAYDHPRPERPHQNHPIP